MKVPFSLCWPTANLNTITTSIITDSSFFHQLSYRKSLNAPPRSLKGVPFALSSILDTHRGHVRAEAHSDINPSGRREETRERSCHLKVKVWHIRQIMKRQINKQINKCEDALRFAPRHLSRLWAECTLSENFSSGKRDASLTLNPCFPVRL